MLMDVILNVVACSLVVYQQYLKFNMSRMNASSFLHKHIYVSLLAILVKKKIYSDAILSLFSNLVNY